MRHWIRVVSAGVGAALCAAPATGALVLEAELDGECVNNRLDHAQLIAPSDFTLGGGPEVFGDGPTASIAGRGGGFDVDFYRFDTAGGAAWFDIDIQPGGGLDTYLALFDEGGTLLAEGFDSEPADPGSADGQDAFIGIIDLAPGTYYVAVSDGANRADASTSGDDLLELVRPDGEIGGVRLFGADPGVSRFDFNEPQVGAGYMLHVSVPGPGGALLLGAVLLCGARRRE